MVVAGSVVVVGGSVVDVVVDVEVVEVVVVLDEVELVVVASVVVVDGSSGALMSSSVQPTSASATTGTASNRARKAIVRRLPWPTPVHPRARTGSTATLSGKIRQQIACIAATLQRVVAITIRDVPDEIRDELAARAARAGKSLQEYVRGLLITAATKPSVDDVIARARARVAATGSRVDPEEIVADRDADRR